MSEKDEAILELRTRNELMEVTHDEKIQEEKDKIVKILEVGFSERQKLALCDLEEGLKKDHRAEMEALARERNEEMMERLEELRQRLVDSSQTSLERCKEKMGREFEERMRRREAEFDERLAREREELDQARAREVEEAAEKVRKKSKLEMESLRSRFRYMQTTCTMDRSPSVSESELSLEVIMSKAFALASMCRSLSNCKLCIAGRIVRAVPEKMTLRSK